jgi:hypothetical protein
MKYLIFSYRRLTQDLHHPDPPGDTAKTEKIELANTEVTSSPECAYVMSISPRGRFRHLEAMSEIPNGKTAQEQNHVREDPLADDSSIASERCSDHPLCEPVDHETDDIDSPAEEIAQNLNKKIEIVDESDSSDQLGHDFRVSYNLHFLITVGSDKATLLKIV